MKTQIYVSKLKRYIQLIVLLAFAIIGFLLIMYAEPLATSKYSSKAGNYPFMWSLIGWFLFLGGGYFLFGTFNVLIQRLLGKRPDLVVDEEGIIDRVTDFQPGRLFWSELGDVVVELDSDEVPVIRYSVTDPDSVEERASSMSGKFLKHKQDQDSSEQAVGMEASLKGMNQSPEELQRIIQKCQNE
ncbi:MAG: STM3941 family protein [bacterium]